jgi:hypothetical protein
MHRQEMIRRLKEGEDSLEVSILGWKDTRETLVRLGKTSKEDYLTILWRCLRMHVHFAISAVYHVLSV